MNRLTHFLTARLAWIIPLLPRCAFRLYLTGIYSVRHGRSPVPEIYTRKGETLAYVGFYRPEYAARLAQAVGPDGKLVLVEAHPDNYARLAAGVEKLPCAHQVEVINKAIWKEEGQVEFDTYEESEKPEHHKVSRSIATPGYEKSGATTMLPCTTVDAVYAAHPDIRHLYITINGAELEALGGMKKYLSTPGNSVWIKSPFRNAETGVPMVEEVEDELRKTGMKVFRCRDANLQAEAGKVYAYQPF